jgi:hypothetical protein
MADDERPDARDPVVAGWLDVEPLDDLARRRLVSNALRETEATVAAPPARGPSRAWRWLGVAAAAVLVVVGGLALITANRGSNTKFNDAGAKLSQTEAASPAESASPAAGPTDSPADFGDLDQPDNFAAARRALDAQVAASKAPAAPDTAGDTAGSNSTFGDRAAASSTLERCRDVVPDGTVLATGTGTLDGRRAALVLIGTTDGTRSLDAVLEDPCELRHLP